MTKKSEYQLLVSKRKNCRDCMSLNEKFVITNQHETSYDTSSIGKWSDWQGNLDAKIMVIGQDWGSYNHWMAYQGQGSDENRTNINLIQLFEVLGYDIGLVSNPNPKAPVFFTNAALCLKGELKTGKMSSRVLKQCFRNCGTKFLKPLIDIIKPEILITLGKAPFSSILKLYDTEGWNKIPLMRNVVRQKPVLLNGLGLKLFPVFHCGGLGISNRSLEEQKKDWQSIKEWL